MTAACICASGREVPHRNCPAHGISAAEDHREPPLCESKNCPNRAIGLMTNRNGVQWAACEKHAKDVLADA